MDVVVVGAGVNGLSCAVALLEAGARVVVRAAEQPRETVSAVAGAMLGPALGGEDPRVLGWQLVSDAWFRELARRPGTGVRVLRGRVLYADPPPVGPVPWTQVPGFVRELVADLPDGYAAGFVADLPVADMWAHLDWLRRRVDGLGGRVETGRVDAGGLGALAAETGADRVVNCAGLGAASLAGDDGLTGVWGQHVVVEAPSVQEFVLGLGAGDAVNVVPHPRGVLVGRVRRTGLGAEVTDEAVAQRTLERASRVLPALAEGRVLGLETGLRPGRGRVRLEAEDRDGVRVVHDYGHDGNGAFLSWGCAQEVVRLCRED